jgi:hypothetical protein
VTVFTILHLCVSAGLAALFLKIEAASIDHGRFGELINQRTKFNEDFLAIDAAAGYGYLGVARSLNASRGKWEAHSIG